jgi:hypothetical protein
MPLANLIFYCYGKMVENAEKLGIQWLSPGIQQVS